MKTYLLLLPLIAFVCLFGLPSQVAARDHFLTIGGGYSPSGNQASLEKNVLFYQRVLKERQLDRLPHAVYFADGLAAEKDLQVIDVSSVPKANRLMAEFFGSTNELGLSYRNHEVPEIRDSTHVENIRKWFKEAGRTMQRGDRLVLYVTGHGKRATDRGRPYNTLISLWDNQTLSVTEVVELLDQLPEGVSVVAVMVQCYTGGFAHFIYNDGDPDKGLSPQSRCGFFATLHDRVAAGCTSEVDEASYVEYSTYFWEAMAGRTRTGEPVPRPDYDGDGTVSLEEAHAYTVLKADTIDLPIKTSGEFLGLESLFANEEHPELLTKNADYEIVEKLANPAERAIFEALSTELSLTGNQRIETARQEGQATRRGASNRSRRDSPSRQHVRLRRRIADDLERRWPELANVLNPGAVELLTTRSQEFVRSVEGHPVYPEYRRQADLAAARPDPQKRRVKFERFVRTAENVILRENLRRLHDQQRMADYQALVEAEAKSLGPPRPTAAADASQAQPDS